MGTAVTTAVSDGVTAVQTMADTVTPLIIGVAVTILILSVGKKMLGKAK